MSALQVVVARNAGLCPGVKRALNEVKRALRIFEKVVFREHTVHNQRVIDDLVKRGLAAYDGKPTQESALFVISAHGASRTEVEEILSQGYDILNTTCQNVQAFQLSVVEHSRKGYQIVILGNSDHAEIRGVVGQANQPVLVVRSAADLADAQLGDKVALFSQTTESREHFDAVASILQNRVADLEVIDTLCPMVQARIQGALETAGNVNAMVVVGDQTSNNTRTLAAILSEKVPTLFVSGREELETLRDELPKDGVVGVTAGAATPPELIDEVVQYLRELA